jgi:hypothetical protein
MENATAETVLMKLMELRSMGDTSLNIYNSSTGKQASKLASCWEELLGTVAGNCLLCARAQHSKLSQSWGTGGWDGAAASSFSSTGVAVE